LVPNRNTTDPAPVKESHLEVVRKIVVRFGPISAGDIYEKYANQVEDPRTRRTLRNYLQELMNRGEVTGSGKARGRVYDTPRVEWSDGTVPVGRATND
jgi:hypothetical protein